MDKHPFNYSYKNKKVLKIFSWYVIIAFFTPAVFLFVGVKQAYADTCTWTGAVNTTASNAGNWSGCSGTAPSSNDDAIINTGSAAITWDISNVGSLTLDIGYTGTT